MACELSRLEYLAKWWGKRQADQVTPADCRGYWQDRKKSIRRGHGGRAVDLEVLSLKGLLAWAVASGKLKINPLCGPLPRFQPNTVRHCRDCAPANDDELHTLARWFFEHTENPVLGWQVLLTAFTGCRTSEVLRLRWDAAPHDPGHQEGEWLWLQRSKGGVNPYAMIHPALRSCLDALAVWRAAHYRDNPFYLPSPWLIGKVVGADLLTHELPIASEALLGRRVIPHGLRAFFVTLRRSNGVSDAQIAAEIGDASGASIIVSTYGAIPPNWQGSTKKLDWLPERVVRRGMH